MHFMELFQGAAGNLTAVRNGRWQNPLDRPKMGDIVAQNRLVECTRCTSPTPPDSSTEASNRRTQLCPKRYPLALSSLAHGRELSEVDKITRSPCSLLAEGSLQHRQGLNVETVLERAPPGLGSVSGRE